MREKPLILLIDDEDLFLEIASVKLRGEGFETIMTNDVRDAFSKAEALQPDLVLSDIYMPPGPNGWEFALQLRRNPKTRNIKLAFFTSLRDPWLEFHKDHQSIIAELGGNVKFFSKTDDVDVLAEEVMRMIKV
jgi:CheY-like chemotaxis protein